MKTILIASGDLTSGKVIKQQCHNIAGKTCKLYISQADRAVFHMVNL